MFFPQARTCALSAGQQIPQRAPIRLSFAHRRENGRDLTLLKDQHKLAPIERKAPKAVLVFVVCFDGLIQSADTQ